MSDTSPVASETSADQGHLKRWTSGWLELWLEWPPFRLLLIGVELGSFIVGAVGVWYAAAALDVANEARRDVRISEARQMLLDPPPGLFDLGEAVRTILLSGANLNALSLTCASRATRPIGAGTRCEPPMYIGEIDLVESRDDAAGLPPRQAMRYAMTRSQFVGVNVYNSRFGGVGFYEAGFRASSFSDVQFSDCRIEASSFEDVDFDGTSFNDCEIASTSFAGADLSDTNFQGSSLFEVNVSGAKLCSDSGCASGLSSESADGMYFFDDDPPEMSGWLAEGSPRICPAASRTNLVVGGVDNCAAPADRGPDVPPPGQDFLPSQKEEGQPGGT